MTRIGSRLRSYREKRGLSLGQAASVAGLSKAHIWELEIGRAENPTITTLLLLCRTYGISIHTLLKGICP